MKLNINVKSIPFKLMGRSRIIEKGKDRVIAGYANVAVVDSDDQYIPLETLQEGMNTLLKDKAFSNLMLSHQNIQIGQILDEYNGLKTKVDNKGLFIVCKLRDDLEIANQIWTQITENQFRGFSIGCEVISDHVECDSNKCMTVLDKINIFEVSVCNHPVNNKSGFVVISKSMLEDDDMCINKDAIDMAKKTSKAKSQEEEPKVEQKEESEAPVEETPEVETKEEEQPEETTEDAPEEPKENSEETPEEQTELTAEEPKIDYKDKLASIEAKISALETLIQQTIDSLSKSEDEPEEEECVECKEEKAEEQETLQEPTEEKAKDEEEDDEDYEEEDEPKKESEPEEDINSKVLEQILELLQKLKSERDFDAELKARDDAIEALDKKIKSLAKPEEAPKVVKKADVKPKTLPSDEPEYVIKRSSKVRVDRGTVYFDD